MQSAQFAEIQTGLFGESNPAKKLHNAEKLHIAKIQTGLFGKNSPAEKLHNAEKVQNGTPLIYMYLYKHKSFVNCWNRTRAEKFSPGRETHVIIEVTSLKFWQKSWSKQILK